MRLNDHNYYSDHRVRASEERSIFRSFNEQKMLAIIELGETEHEVPIRFEVCGTCDGKGKHVNPSVDADGLTSEDFAEDPDLAENYMSGMYDVTCYGCRGRRVKPVLNREEIDPALLKQIDEAEKSEREFRAIQRAERSMGA